MEAVVPGGEHMLTASWDEISTSEGWQFIAIEGLETLLWFSLAGMGWWNYLSYFSWLVVIWKLVLWQQWWVFIGSAGADSEFVKLFSLDKWLHVPYYTFQTYMAFVVLEVLDFMETNSYVWWFALIPGLEYLYFRWVSGLLSNKYELYPGYVAAL